MHALPQALAPMAAYRQFIIYVLVPSDKPGKMDKLPCDFRTGRVTAKGTGGAHNPEIWTDAPTAIAAAAQYNLAGGQRYGVGFVFTSYDPFWFLDIDGAHDGNDWSPLAKQLVAAFPGAAVEVSTSGRGLHIFGTGHVPPHSSTCKAYGLEFYTSLRFVALTGINAAGSAAADFSHLMPSLVGQFFPPHGGTAGADDFELSDEPVAEWNGSKDDDKLIERMMRSVSARAAFGAVASFADLFNCNVDVLAKVYPDTSGSHPYDQSAADGALAQLLCFWTGNHGERVKRIMLRSALVREKWEREDYLPRTIAGCCARQTQFLTDLEPEPVAWAADTALSVAATGASGPPRATNVAGSTFLSPEQQVDMFAGCVYVVDQHRVLVKGGALIKESQFRVQFGGYTLCMDNANERTTRDAWEAFTQSQAFRCPRADTICFRPDLPPGELVHDAGRVRVNTWWPVEVPRQVGDITPFWTHLCKLLPDERDRQILLSYMAACVQHKGVKFQWAPIIQGVEGNGKTLLSRCVAEAVGRRYVHWPKASKLSKEFNGWMVGKVFYAVEDIYIPDGRRDVIEEMKPMITGGDGLEIENKGVDQYSFDICGNFMINTNHEDSVFKTRRDRRYASFYTAQQEFEHLARDGMDGAYMSALYTWLKTGGYAIVAELLHTFPIPDELNPATSCQRAPSTSSTERAIMETQGGVEQEVMHAIEQQHPGFQGGWISSLALGKLLESLGLARRITHNKRHKLLSDLGYVKHPALLDGITPEVVPFPDAGRPRLYVKPNSREFYLPHAGDVARAYANAQQVKLPTQ